MNTFLDKIAEILPGRYMTMFNRDAMCSYIKTIRVCVVNNIIWLICVQLIIHHNFNVPVIVTNNISFYPSIHHPP